MKLGELQIGSGAAIIVFGSLLGIANSYFRFNGQLYYLTDLLHKQRVALKEFADGGWKIYYSFYPIGILDLRKNRVLKLN